MTRHRLGYLDGLRGIAALAVVLHHCMLALHPAYANYGTHYLDDAHRLPFAPVALLWQGNLCVCVFFAISGFVLAPALARSQSALAALMVRRILRLALPILAALLFGYALLRLGAYRNADAAAVSGSQGWWGLLFAGPPRLRQVFRDVFVMPFATVDSAYDPVVWMMHIEYAGSFVMFVLYKLLRRSRYRIAALSIAACVTIGTYYVDFAAGALFAELAAGERCITLPPSARRAVIALLMLLFVLFGAAVWSGGPGQRFHWLDLLPETLLGPGAEKSHQAAAIFLLASVILSRRLQAMLAWKPLLKTGHVSFALYLLHLPILCSLGAVVLLATHARLGLVYAAVLCVGSVMCASLALAMLFTRFIDAPATRISQIGGHWIDILWNRYCTAYVGKIWHLVRHGQAS